MCIGLSYRTNAFVHHKTSQNCDSIKQVVDEVRSHSELCTLPFTSIQINHNPTSAPHTDDNLYGAMSIAMGLGEYAGGRLRVDGAKQPLHIRDHALCTMGAQPTRQGCSMVTNGR